MKILHVITSLRTGGAEKLMVDLLPRMKQKDYDVELILFDGVRTPFYELLEKTGVKIYALRTNSSVYDLRNVYALVPYIRHADIVHTHNTASQLFAAIANMFVGKRLFTTEHNTTNRRRNHFFYKPLDLWMYSRYEKIICISDKAAYNLKNYLIGDEETSSKIVTIYNGIDMARYAHFEGACPDSRPVKIVTMVAAFREQKDQKTLIKAMALLPDDYLLRLVGTGDAGLIKICKELVSELGLTQKVSFMGMRSDVPALLNESDVVVLSSHYEGLSLSSIEGMASGKPFIASDVDGLHEIVDGYGILFPHEDEVVLAEAIKRCIEDKKYAKQVAEKCQERAKQYDISIMTEKYLSCYFD